MGVLLTPEETRTLLRKARRKCTASLHKLVEHNLGLVGGVIRKHFAWRINASYTFEDMFQTGVTGLIRAINKFDLSRKTRLSTYATWWIRQAIQRDLAFKDHEVHVPLHAERKFTMVHDVEDFIVDKEMDATDIAEIRELMRVNLKWLTEREREIIIAHRMNEYTLEEIGQWYGLTRERIRQIEFKAFEKLRRHIKRLTRDVHVRVPHLVVHDLGVIQ